MAFTLEIKSKSIFGAILQNCGLTYGQDGKFFILKEGMGDDVAT